MRRRVLVGTLVVLALAAPVRAQQPPEGERPAITVTGEGIVRAEPDRAVLRFGIVTRSDSAEAARRENARAAASAMNAVRELGVPDEDLRLESLVLYPDQQRDPDTGEVRAVTYEAQRTLVVQVDSLGLVPTLVARVVQQGANRLDGLSYELAERDSARNAALREAVRDARAKAELLASTVDAELGPVWRVSEQSFDMPAPAMMRMEAPARGGQAAPEPDAYAPGRVEVRATVHVVWELAVRGAPGGGEGTADDGADGGGEGAGDGGGGGEGAGGVGDRDRASP